MVAAHSELGPLGRDLAIWESHLRSTGKSPHTVKSYIQRVRALAAWLSDEGLPLDPERITTSQLREFQAHPLLPKDRVGAGKRTSTVCTRQDGLKLLWRSRAKWLMAELVRTFHDVDVATATEVVDASVERMVPIIWDVGDQRRVLDPSLTQRDRTLLLLYASTGPVKEVDLISRVEARTHRPTEGMCFESSIANG